MADTRQIELAAISAVNNVFLKTKNMIPNISYNDKTVSFDGNIEIYNGTVCKTNLIDIFPVQVKGRSVKEYSQRIPIQLDDVKNYLIKKKVLFFHVEFLSLDEYKIYYNPMLLYDIDQFIRKCSPKKSMTVDFCEFPTEIDKVVERVTYFSNESKKQNETIQGVNSIEDFKTQKIGDCLEISLPQHNTDICNLLELYDKESIYVYHSDSTNCKHPIDKLGENLHLGLVGETDDPLLIDGKIVQKHCKFSITSQGHTLNISKNIEVVYGKTGNPDDCVHMKCKKFDTGSLNERIFDLEVIIAASENKLYWGDRCLSFIFDENTLERARNDLAYYKRIKALVEKIGIRKEIDFENMTPEDYHALNNLAFCELYDATLAIKKTKDDNIDGNTIIHIGNLNILCHCERIDDANAMIYSIFNDRYSDIEGLACKYYVFQDFGTFDEIDNVNFQTMITELFKHLDSAENIESTNRIVLNLLLFYDKTNDNSALNTSFTIASKLVEISNSILSYKINLYQIKKRQNAISESDLAEIIRLKEETNDINFKWACSILLDSKSEAQLYFKQLSIDQQEEMKDYPIYNLYKLLVQ